MAFQPDTHGSSIALDLQQLNKDEWIFIKKNLGKVLPEVHQNKLFSNQYLCIVNHWITVKYGV